MGFFGKRPASVAPGVYGDKPAVKAVESTDYSDLPPEPPKGFGESEVLMISVYEHDDDFSVNVEGIGVDMDNQFIVADLLRLAVNSFGYDIEELDDYDDTNDYDEDDLLNYLEVHIQDDPEDDAAISVVFKGDAETLSDDETILVVLRMALYSYGYTVVPMD